MKIEIKSTEVDSRSGTRADGKPWSIRTQKGYAHLGDDYPVKVSLQLEQDQAAYPAGMYTMLDSSFFVGQYDKLQIGKINLQSIDKLASPVRAA